MAKEGAFTKIYASAFMFDDKGVAVWPAQAINYTNKTQFLFRIQKGILDINDTGVNDYVKPEDCLLYTSLDRMQHILVQMHIWKRLLPYLMN